MKDSLTKCNPSYAGVRADVLDLVYGCGNSVLDVGCANGSNGRYLMQKGVAGKIIGVEINSLMAAEAQSCLTKVIYGSIENQNTIDQVRISAPYNYILLSDVAEHLVDPWNVLRSLSSMLTVNGKIILSVPNVQHFDVFVHVFIKGYWPYNERGIFDRTHLRWFTLRNAYQLIESADLQVQEMRRKFRFRDYAGSKFPFYGRLLKYFLADYFTFQYIFVCGRRGA